MSDERSTSISHIRQACKAIAVEMMKIHPALPGLGDEAAKSEIVKALFEATKNVEVIKKKLARLESSDDSKLL